MRSIVFILILHISSCSHFQEKDKECYHYKKVNITGTLEVRPYPNEESSYWIIVTKPFCTITEKNEGLYKAYNSQTEIHLSLGKFNRYRHLINKRVSVSGDLYSRHTRHHMRNILISVDEIKGIK